MEDIKPDPVNNSNGQNKNKKIYKVDPTLNNYNIK